MKKAVAFVALMAFATLAVASQNQFDAFVGTGQFTVMKDAQKVVPTESEVGAIHLEGSVYRPAGVDYSVGVDVSGALGNNLAISCITAGYAWQHSRKVQIRSGFGIGSSFSESDRTTGFHGRFSVDYKMMERFSVRVNFVTGEAFTKGGAGVKVEF